MDIRVNDRVKIRGDASTWKVLYKHDDGNVTAENLSNGVVGKLTRASIIEVVVPDNKTTATVQSEDIKIITAEEAEKPKKKGQPRKKKSGDS